MELLEEKARLAEPMRKGLSRMLNLGLTLAFNAWVDRYQHICALRSLACGCMGENDLLSIRVNFE